MILEITEGPKKIRDLFRRGYEINGSALGEANLALEEVKALRSIRRILKSLKEIPGVGEISLTGAPEASENPARQPADSASPPGKPAWENPLMQKIQMELDASPFLEEQKIKMRVLDEMDGRVSLELSSGPKQLRDLFRKGYELNGNGLGEVNLKPDSVKALRSIKRTLKPIKGFAEVKEIALTGAVDFLMDPAQDLYEQAGEKINHSDSRVRCEAIPLLIKSAELGFAPAQADLAKAYSLGIDVRQDDKKAFYWLEKAAQQGDPTTQFNLGGLCVQGRGTSRNYKQGIAWYRTAAEQDCDTEVRARSQVALASLLATCPDPTLRDGEAALAYAQKGYAAAPDGIAIEVLAFAYARCGRFEEALEQEKRWLQKLEKAKYLPPKQKESLIEKAQYRIELFKGRQAYTLPE
ncbi:MAG: tetratricopeptide repeat protein [Verrucomicrobia bacterium]|nr:tetratricopeptide repeat protein [Verrucomicrobiota bacterium]